METMPYETDERLKSRLDTNQLSRERMCLAVMAIDRRFSDVRPRHPRGGPDGARDIDATFKGVQRVFGAVGFVNQANDSDQHKKAAQDKFKDDLSAALEQQPKPQVFIFFTNVNLTLGEKDDLVQIAQEQGMAHSEIFDRERLRVALDSPDGLGIRFQYLDLPLSEPEQAAFFSRWGDDIQGVIASGFNNVQASLNRILFLHEAQMPLKDFTLILDLDREYSGDEVGHFRAFALVFLKGPFEEHKIISMLFGATDNSTRLQAENSGQLSKQNSGIKIGVCGAQWEAKVSDRQRAENIDPLGGRLIYQRTSTSTAAGRHTLDRIVIQYSNDFLVRFAVGPRLLDMDDCRLILELNRSLADKLKTIRIYANEYQLAQIARSICRIEQPHQQPEIPLIFSDEELSDSWVTVRPTEASAFHIRFAEQTPRRFFSPQEVISPPKEKA
jgi:hypothetical protein